VDVLYWRPPTDSDLLATPWYKPEDFPAPNADVWDENWDIMQLFVRFSTQWRVGMSGPVSLDYTIFIGALERKGYTGDAFDEALDKLAVIEAQALYNINKK
jgi:hypothetical protein